MPFELHPRLSKSCHLIGKSGGCQILLKDNAAFPWILIVPEVDEGIEDLHQLSAAQFTEVVFLIRQVSGFMSDYFQPEKLNVACIGNQVRQMHIHLVGRSSDDPAWPETVWASEIKPKYDKDEIIEICVRARIDLDLSEPT
ncbi:HIT family protein [bacterium]|jgi:diadenosine tetraphosphate (Ap4A) HIT family hydrolase|nr:HIT family protein [Akkermansiaceae bacterium]MDA7907265.1 HIT family protein [Akkermansiaceae bacterium]MDB4713276.1 HIT family protein [bacterium]